MNANVIEEARKVLKTRSDRSIPIDIVGIIESYGICYNEIDLDNEISGVLDMRVKDKPRIIVNASHYDHRKRFSAAHELGHYILHVKTGMHIDKNTFWRMNKDYRDAYIMEKEANTFAAEVLMPTNIIDSFINDNDEILFDDLVEKLSAEFNVSEAAMSIKLTNALKAHNFDIFDF